MPGPPFSGHHHVVRLRDGSTDSDPADDGSPRQRDVLDVMRPASEVPGGK